MVYNYRSGLAARGANQGFWLSMDEQEFADQLAAAHWGPGAIEQELVNLRAYKAQFRLDKPPVRTVEQIGEQIEAAAAANPEKPVSRFLGVLDMRRQKRERKHEESNDA